MPFVFFSLNGYFEDAYLPVLISEKEFQHQETRFGPNETPSIASLDVTSNVQNSDGRISCSPNPCADWTNITYSASSKITYQVFNCQGELVLDGYANKSPLNLNTEPLSSGMYTIVFQNTALRAQFIKQ
jgi:hypothetical protein